MSINRWDPLRELEEMSRRLNRLYPRRELTGPETGRQETMTVSDWIPAVDIQETPEDYIVKAELPEVKREDVSVAVQDGILTVRGERKMEKEEKNRKFHRVERTYGNFFRSFTLPADVSPEDVRAEMKDGVLVVRLHKSAKPKPQAIDIKVS